MDCLDSQHLGRNSILAAGVWVRGTWRVTALEVLWVADSVSQPKGWFSSQSMQPFQAQPEKVIDEEGARCSGYLFRHFSLFFWTSEQHSWKKLIQTMASTPLFD